MECPHCRTNLPPNRPFNRTVESGLAYAQTCTACDRVVAIRPRTHSDPPLLPGALTRREVARLLFVRWRLANECADQTRWPAARLLPKPRAAA